MVEIIKCVCSCVDVEFGSYDNQVMLPFPEHMQQYRENRVAVGLSDKVCIDVCILPQIETLWGREIKTSGCCCGHGKIEAYIGVLDDVDAIEMEALGYLHDQRSASPRHCFLA